jgi:hypothetical protein
MQTGSKTVELGSKHIAQSAYYPHNLLLFQVECFLQATLLALNLFLQ